MKRYETVIGLEVHAQLKTASKMFCSCANRFGDAPNTNICPVCTGQPGVLPVINKNAIELAIKTALALRCRINKQSIFARKHYFYPDLPKDFQISQFELPLAEFGYIEIEVSGVKKKIGITRIHLEEDAGKLVHKGAARIMGSDYSLADYNRAATPLMEIVSEPDIRSPEEAKAYMEALAHVLEYIDICDAKMEEGSLRCDANISIRPVGQEIFGTKTEVKNMNSFKAVMKALAYEEKRQEEVLEDGGAIIQETRFFDDQTETTSGMRTKEGSHDYRYFPEPDLVPLEPTPQMIEQMRESIGELPWELEDRLVKDYRLTPETVKILISDRFVADFFMETIKGLPQDKAKLAANWILRDVMAYMKENKKKINELKLTPQNFTEMLKLIDNGTINNKIAAEILAEILNSGKNVQDIIKEKGLTQVSDEGELVKIIEEVIKNNPTQVEQFKSGKEAVLMFLVGQVMKQTKGRAKPDVVQKLLRQNLTK